MGVYGLGGEKAGGPGGECDKKNFKSMQFQLFSYQIHSTLNLHHTLIYMNMHFSYFYYS